MYLYTSLATEKSCYKHVRAGIIFQNKTRLNRWFPNSSRLAPPWLPDGFLALTCVLVCSTITRLNTESYLTKITKYSKSKKEKKERKTALGKKIVNCS